MLPITGWLEKKSIFGIWFKRYVMLSTSKLSFYKKTTSLNAESEYELNSDTEVQHGSSNDCIIRIKFHFPKVVNLILRTESANEMLSWSFQIKQTALANKAIYIGMFDVISLLGQGFYGKVTLCEKKGSKEIVAIKSVKKKKSSEENTVNSILNEKKILTTIQNPFIVNLKYAFQSSKFYYLALEYAAGGDLYHLMKARKLTMNEIKLYIAEISIAIKELHNNNIIYGDVKPENIMIGNDGHIKLIDFGLSTFCKPNEKVKKVCGTTEYLAPEVLLNEGYGTQIDWWGIGILTYELLYKSTPFAGMNKQYIYQSILKKEPIFPKDEDKVVVSFITSLLQKDPCKRAGYTDIVKSEFMKDFDFKDIYDKKIFPSFIPNIDNLKDTSNFDSRYTKEKLRNSDYITELDSTVYSDDSFSYNCVNDTVIITDDLYS